MLEASSTATNALQTSKQVLFVVHEYLPMQLALWVPTMVALLKKANKDVTILVSQDVFGWQKKIDEVYPVDMVLALEQLKQVISVPITNQSKAIGDVSYAVEEGKLEITVVPQQESLDMSGIKTITYGKTYDVVIGVGVQSNHPVLEALKNHQASLSRAKGFFVGIISPKATLLQSLPFVPSMTVIEQQESSFLQEVIVQLSENVEPAALHYELMTLFALSILKPGVTVEASNQPIYEYLAKVKSPTLDTAKIKAALCGDLSKQNAILSELLHFGKLSSNGETMLYGVSVEDTGLQGISVQEIVTSLFYLPKYPQVQNTVVVVQENERKHHVYVTGTNEIVKQVAVKYGFPKSEFETVGVVTDVVFEKLTGDLTRVVAKEEMMPTVGVKGSPVTKVSDAVEEDVDVPTREIPVSGQIPYSPSLDEVLANTQVQGVQQPVPQEQPVPQTQDTAAPQEIQNEDKTPQGQAPESPLTTVKTSSGLDFAAIARKMRESIT